MTTGSRSLRLLSLLQSRRFWPGPELAERLAVSERTLRRDVDRLRELGYPVDARPGVDGGYALAPGASLPPLVVDDDEAMALAVAIWSQVAGGDGDDAAVRALTKITQVMPSRMRRRLDAVRTTLRPGRIGDGQIVLDQATVTTIALACRDRERVDLAYRAIDGVETKRRVEPDQLVSLGRRWYLVGYDLTRQDWRTLRIDRILRATSTGVAFAPRRPPYADAATWVSERVSGASGGGRFRAEAVIEAPAAVTRSRVGTWAEVQAEGEHCSRMAMDTDSLDWPLFVLGSIGVPFTVVGPPELGRAALEWAARFSGSVEAESREASAQISSGAESPAVPVPAASAESAAPP